MQAIEDNVLLRSLTVVHRNKIWGIKSAAPWRGKRCESEMKGLKSIDCLRYSVGLFVLLDSIGWSMVIPVLPKMTSQFGMNAMGTSTLTSVVSLITLLSSPLQGKIGDSIGKTTMFNISAVAQVFGFFLMIFALRSGSLPLFILGRCIPASCKCGMVLSQALLYEYSPNSESYMKDIGLLTACLNGAYVVGPILGGMLFEVMGPNVLLVASIFCGSGSLAVYSTEIFMKRLTKEGFLKNNKAKTAKSSGSSSTASNSSGHEQDLIHYLHLKFVFQLGNCLFEGMFSVQAFEQFSFSAAETGMLWGWCGVVSSITSATLLPFITKQFKGVAHSLLPHLCVATFLGLIFWAVTEDRYVVVMASTAISVSSTLFVCIIQGMIASTQQAACKPSDDPAKDDAQANESLTSSASKTNIGLVMGYSSTADRAARILTPLIGSAAKVYFGTVGFAGYCSAVFVYCFSLTLYVIQLASRTIEKTRKIEWSCLFVRLRSFHNLIAIGQLHDLLASWVRLTRKDMRKRVDKDPQVAVC